jgi:hypothetical protein
VTTEVFSSASKQCHNHSAVILMLPHIFNFMLVQSIRLGLLVNSVSILPWMIENSSDNRIYKIRDLIFRILLPHCGYNSFPVRRPVFFSTDEYCLYKGCVYYYYYYYYYYVSCHRPILPGNFLEPTVIPTVQASSFTMQYFPYYV